MIIIWLAYKFDVHAICSMILVEQKYWYSVLMVLFEFFFTHIIIRILFNCCFHNCQSPAHQIIHILCSFHSIPMRKNCFFPFVHFRFVLLSQHLHLSVMAILLLASCNSLPAHHNHNHNYRLINLFLWFFTHNIHLTYISFVFQSTLSPNNWTWKSSWLLIIWLLILTKQKIFSMNTCSRYNKRSWRCQLWVFCSIGMIMANCSRRYWLIRLFVFWFNFLFFFFDSAQWSIVIVDRMAVLLVHSNRTVSKCNSNYSHHSVSIRRPMLRQTPSNKLTKSNRM